jgi:hypothetical protein
VFSPDGSEVDPSEPEFKIAKSLKLGEKLGSGAQGVVYRGTIETEDDPI